MLQDPQPNRLSTAWLLTLWSVLFLIPLWLARGVTGVANTYAEGALRFWTAQDPYAPGVIGDVFQYSPLFAALYGVFLGLPDVLHSLAWGFLNAFVFWVGVCRWVSFRWRMSLWLWFALAMAAMELDISLRYHQINALLVGLILIAVNEYRRGQFASSAVLFSFGTNIKILPVAFAGGLFYPVRKQFIFAFFASFLVFLLLPALVRGWDGNLQLLAAQVNSLATDLSHRSITDLRTVLERLELPLLGWLLRSFVAVVTVGLFAICRFVFEEDEFPWELWISLGLTALLLLNPRTESPTFVFASPVYLFLMARLKGNWRWVVALSALMVTVNYTSVWPPLVPFPFHHLYGAKSLGTFVLWVVTVTLLGQRLGERLQHFKFKKAPRTITVGNV